MSSHENEDECELCSKDVYNRQQKMKTLAQILREQEETLNEECVPYLLENWPQIRAEVDKLVRGLKEVMINSGTSTLHYHIAKQALDEAGFAAEGDCK